MTSRADAQESKLPTEKIQLPSGITLRPKPDGKPEVFFVEQAYKCYTVPEYAQVVDLVNQYYWFWTYSEGLEHKLDLRLKEIDGLNASVSAWKHTAERAEGSMNILSSLLDAERDSSEQILRSKKIELWGWRVASVLLVGSVVAMGTVGLSD